MSVLTFQPNVEPVQLGEEFFYTVKMFDGETQFMPAPEQEVTGITGEDLIVFEVVEGELIVPFAVAESGAIELSVTDSEGVEMHSGTLDITPFLTVPGEEDPEQEEEELPEDQPEDEPEEPIEEPEDAEETRMQLEYYGCDAVLDEDEDSLPQTIRTLLLTRDDVLVRDGSDPLCAVRRELQDGQYVIHVAQLGAVDVPDNIQALHNKILTGPVKH